MTADGRRSRTERSRTRRGRWERVSYGAEWIIGRAWSVGRNRCFVSVDLKRTAQLESRDRRRWPPDDGVEDRGSSIACDRPRAHSAATAFFASLAWGECSPNVEPSKLDALENSQESPREYCQYCSHVSLGRLLLAALSTLHSREIMFLHVPSCSLFTYRSWRYGRRASEITGVPEVTV